MAHIDKQHSLTLAIREVLYRFDSHKDDCFDSPQIIECIKTLKDLLWNNKSFWETVGIAESWNFSCEDENLHSKVDKLTSDVEWLRHCIEYREKNENK